MRSTKHLTALLHTVLQELGLPWPEKTTIEPPKDKKFGDLAVNCALLLAKQAGKPPRTLAEEMAKALMGASADIARAEVAGPGFVNVTFTPAFWQENIVRIEEQGDAYGSSTLGKGKKMQVEFVSANPTGPLHVGHGRGAAVGDSMVRILRFSGYETEAEYYLNDAGNQMQTLGLSIWLRVQELAGNSTAAFPETCYQGEYITDIARGMLQENAALPAMPEAEGRQLCYETGLAIILDGIKTDLKNFRVHHDVWFSELSLVANGEVERILDAMKASGHVYEADGALWFRSSALGDDKDRVLRKSDGSLTYFASDIAYHANKYSRGFDAVIDVWGADHHGYIPRMRACIEALGRPAEAFDVILVQLVNLMREGKQVAMSTRAGEFETLEDVLKDVGVDAARFIFLSRKSDSKLDFDLDLVRQRTMDNPVYYVQYAHARVKAVLRRAAEQGIGTQASSSLALLQEEEALDLLRCLDRFPQVVQEAATGRAPHFISYYLMDLAGLLHKYYAVHQVVAADNPEQTAARLRLLQSVAQTVKNGLLLLGVEAPDSM